MDARPRFRTEKNRRGQVLRVFLQCSNCYKDIREIKPNDTVSTVRGHYCSDCDDGVAHLNRRPNDNQPDKGE